MGRQKRVKTTLGDRDAPLVPLVLFLSYVGMYFVKFKFYICHEACGIVKGMGNNKAWGIIDGVDDDFRPTLH